MSQELMYEMYRLLAIAKYEARYVIPTAYAAEGHRLEETVTECSLDFDGGPGMYTGSGPFGEASGQPVPVAVETFQALQAAADIGNVGCPRGPRLPGEPAELGRQGYPGRHVHPAARFAPVDDPGSKP